MKRVIAFLIFIATINFAQDIKINGKVVCSETGAGLPLVNIQVKGTSNGTISDEAGYFSLGNINSKAALIFSYIGYAKREIPAVYFQKHQIVKMNREILQSQTVYVEGSITDVNEAGAYSSLSREDIKKNYIVQDVPEYLSFLPSSTFFSETGSGLGYNYLSIRGFDQRRISVAVNGIVQNDPEDHNVYWIDMPDILGNTELIQVQRGAGSGITGYPSVGGALNIITKSVTDKPLIKLSASAGSFNTRKYAAELSSGIINGKYSVYARLSQILSTGYKEQGWVDLTSYYLSAVRFDGDLTSQINIYGGPVADGLSYTGIPKFAVKDKKLRRKNYSYWEAENGKFTYAAERRTDETEEFSQPHFELLNEYKLTNDITLNSALFYMIGEGHFDFDGSWGNLSYFRITPENGFSSITDPEDYISSDLIIRAYVKNKQWGWIPRLSLKYDGGRIIAGSEFRFHRSLHWGNINYSSLLPVEISKDYRYYSYRGGKDIITAFINNSIDMTENINITGELQLAYHKYMIYDEDYMNNEFELDGLFLNPKLSFGWTFDENANIYASFASVKREPRLKNYYDAAESSGGEVPLFQKKENGNYDFSSPLVKPETMNDFELGVKYSNDGLDVSLNLFYMVFSDEIIKNGKLDQFGQPKTGNMDGTLHRGAELSLKYEIWDDLNLISNLSYSRNTITDGYYFFEGETGSVEKLDMKNNTIGGFPEVIINAILRYSSSNINIELYGKYLSESYSDNFGKNLTEYRKKYPGITSYDDNRVDSYFTAGAGFSARLPLSRYLQGLRIYGKIDNLFNKLYAAYAVGKEFFPAAERNYIIGIDLEL